jgi:hypothetical protein
MIHPPAQNAVLSRLVRDLNVHFIDLWWQCPVSLPPLGLTYTSRQQREHEGEAGRFLDWLQREVKHLPPPGLPRRAFQEQLEGAVSEFVKIAFGLESRHLEAIRTYSFLEILDAFAKAARRFDPQVREADIYQASRNVWSMNFIQLLLQQTVELTPSIAAYSLLYPYTDNYLDDPAVSSEIKRAFNERLGLHIAGEPQVPANRMERMIFDLVGQIEGQFERDRFPEVYSALHTIYQAQSASVGLLGDRSPYEVDILGMTFQKGGTSVLADGYLVAGNLDADGREFTYHYGAFTQLMDDLEDVVQDRMNGQMSIFSQAAGRWPLDAITNRTFHFGNLLLATIDRITPAGTQAFQEILHKSFAPLLIASIGAADTFYSRAYVQEMEAHFPVRFSFLKARRKQLERSRLPVTALLNVLAARGSGQ